MFRTRDIKTWSLTAEPEKGARATKIERLLRDVSSYPHTKYHYNPSKGFWSWVILAETQTNRVKTIPLLISHGGNKTCSSVFLVTATTFCYFNWTQIACNYITRSRLYMGFKWHLATNDILKTAPTCLFPVSTYSHVLTTGHARGYQRPLLVMNVTYTHW